MTEAGGADRNKGVIRLRKLPPSAPGFPPRPRVANAPLPQTPIRRSAPPRGAPQAPTSPKKQEPAEGGDTGLRESFFLRLQGYSSPEIERKAIVRPLLLAQLDAAMAAGRKEQRLKARRLRRAAASAPLPPAPASNGAPWKLLDAGIRNLSRAACGRCGRVFDPGERFWQAWKTWKNIERVCLSCGAKSGGLGL